MEEETNIIYLKKNLISREHLNIVRNVLDGPHWKFGYISTEPNRQIWGFDEKIANGLREYFSPYFPEYEIHSINCNGQTIGQQASLHHDSIKNVTHVAVFFPDRWQYIDGGRLHIFVEDGPPIIITPEENFAVIFPADLKHYAEAPSANKLRRSVGIKMKSL